MNRRNIRSLNVSEIGMGCMGFSHGYGQTPDVRYAEDAIREAFDYGCNFFDTAEGYGKELYYPGHNEEMVQLKIVVIKKREKSKNHYL